MAPLILSNGKILLVDGKIATSTDCCCDKSCLCVYYKFDEPNALDNAIDSAQGLNANIRTLSTMPSVGAIVNNGRHGTGSGFERLNESNACFSLQKGYTFFGWAYQNSGSTPSTVASKENEWSIIINGEYPPNPGGWAGVPLCPDTGCRRGGLGFVQFTVGSASVGVGGFTGPLPDRDPDILPGVWYFICAWVNISEQKIYLRVIGPNIGDITRSVSYTSLPNMAVGTFEIGNPQGGAKGTVYPGYEMNNETFGIDECGIITRVLTSAEQLYYYNNGSGRNLDDEIKCTTATPTPVQYAVFTSVFGDIYYKQYNTTNDSGINNLGANNIAALQLALGQNPLFPDCYSATLSNSIPVAANNFTSVYTITSYARLNPNNESASFEDCYNKDPFI